MAATSQGLAPEACPATWGGGPGHLSLQTSATTELLPFPRQVGLGPTQLGQRQRGRALRCPHPRTASAQGGAVESWEAEPAPGRTGLSLLLLVNPVTWKRGDRLWTPARPAWASGEPQHSQRSPGSHFSGHKPVQLGLTELRGLRPTCYLRPVQATPPAPSLRLTHLPICSHPAPTHIGIPRGCSA